MRKIWISSILFSAAVHLSTSVYAQDSETIARARDRFNRGVELYGEDEYEAALAEFRLAYELTHHYAVLYNIAQALNFLDRHPEALAAYERYLADGGAEIPRARQAEVRQQLARLRRLVGRIAVDLQCPTAATLLIDGVVVGEAPLREAQLVSSGEHVVELRATGYLPETHRVSVASEDQVDLQVCLQAIPGGVAEGEPPPTQHRIEEDSTDEDSGITASQLERHRRYWIAGWVTGGIGVAFLGTTLGLFIWNNGREDQGYSSDEELAELRTSLHAWSAVEWAFLGIGIAAVTTSIVLLVLGRHRRLPPSTSWFSWPVRF